MHCVWYTRCLEQNEQVKEQSTTKNKNKKSCINNLKQCSTFGEITVSILPILKAIKNQGMLEFNEQMNAHSLPIIII